VPEERTDAERARRRLVLASIAAVVVAAVVGGGIGLLLARRANTPATPDPFGTTDRPIPSAIVRIPLVDEAGRTTDLAAFRGRVVILADFMTSCQEICPITTGALLTVERSLRAAHLQRRVTIVEASIDPGRDTPSRFRAYDKAFGVHWTMLTGSVANLDRLWSWFGVVYQRVAEGKPPAIDWQTGKPYTYDVAHSDEVFVLDRSGVERAVTAGNPNTGGKLSAALARTLNANGRQNLAHAGFGSWTPADLLNTVGSVLGQSIPLASGA